MSAVGHFHRAEVLDPVGEEQLLVARRRLFAMVGRVDDVRDSGDLREVDRWEQAASRARISLCEVIGDDRLVNYWTRWHRQRWAQSTAAIDELGDTINSDGCGGPA